MYILFIYLLTYLLIKKIGIYYWDAAHMWSSDEIVIIESSNICKISIIYDILLEYIYCIR